MLHSPDGPSTRILLVEDDDALRELLRMELEAVGYRVEAHRSAEDALRQQSGRTQLAVLDYRLPGIDGLELLQRLKAVHPQLRALMVTSEPRELNRRRPAGCGAEAVIRKPFPFVRLLEALRAIDTSGAPSISP
jgi:DNA-binding response OmpR family regulator